MVTVQIADKLSNLYCSKAEVVLDKLNHKFYGINCGLNEADYPVDGDLQITLLEYFSLFNEEDLEKKIIDYSCLK